MILIKLKFYIIVNIYAWLCSAVLKYAYILLYFFCSLQCHPNDYVTYINSTEEEKKRRRMQPILNRMAEEKKQKIIKQIMHFYVKERIPLSKLDSIHFNNLLNGTNWSHLECQCIE